MRRDADYGYRTFLSWLVLMIGNQPFLEANLIAVAHPGTMAAPGSSAER